MILQFCPISTSITVIVSNVKRKQVPLTYDNGDIDLLKEYLPEFVVEPFDGRIERYNWLGLTCV